MGQDGDQGADQQRDSQTSTPTLSGTLQTPPPLNSHSQDSLPSDDGGH